nr:uncharacterized protein LOC111768007 [Equus caballus]
MSGGRGPFSLSGLPFLLLLLAQRPVRSRGPTPRPGQRRRSPPRCAWQRLDSPSHLLLFKLFTPPVGKNCVARCWGEKSFLRFEKSTQVDVFEKFVRLGNGLCQYEQPGEIASRRLLLRHVEKKLRGVGTPGDAEEQVGGGASPAGAVPGLRSPEAPRRICAPGAAPALGKVACASTSRPRRSICRWRRGEEDAGARGAARGAGGPLSCSPRLWSPRAHNRAAETSGARENEGTGSPAPRLLSATPSGAPKGREKRGGPGAASGPTSPSAAGARALRSPSSPRSGPRLRTKPRVSARPGRARAGPRIGSLAPLRTHLAFTYPGRAVER